MVAMNTEDDQVAEAPRLGRYAIDPQGSSITFRTRHLFGALPVSGRFAVRGGTVDVCEPLADSAVHADVAAESFASGNPARDAAVRSGQFLDAAAHPVITFAAEHVGDATVEGVLTVRGTTRPVTLTVTALRRSPDGFTAEATARVDRTAFGVTAARGMVARFLDLTVRVTCVRG
jgi:polyisoprenoid-binding protein YceI